MIKYINYNYIDLPRLTIWVAKELIDSIVNGLTSIRTTFDLGISSEKAIIEDDCVIIRRHYRICIDELNLIEEDKVYEITDYGLRAILISDGGVYKLKPVSKDTAPTLEINGIHMHRIVGITPWMDSYLKVHVAKVRRGHYVLDTCMGLGYTAIHSILRGAYVLTVEIDPNVIEITRHNPWSKRLEDQRIRIIHGDITKVIYELGDQVFHRIIHDPPRFTPRTGDLYSLELYKEFYRVLKPNGILFHYTGEPRRHGGPRIVKGIGERLRRAGFIVKYNRRVQGYIAKKF